MRGEILDALRATNIAAYFRLRFGKVRISGKAATEQYHFPAWVVAAYDESHVAPRTGGAANSKKLYPLAELVAIEQAGKIEESVYRYDINNQKNN